VASVPEGQFDDDRRRAIVSEITDAVLAAERGACPPDAMRVWVFANDISNGTWGGNRRVNKLADIAGFVLGDPDKGREYARRRLGAKVS
jgi:hypothetical protein